MGSEIYCRKSGSPIAYSAGDMDLIRTFGESRGTEIAKRYEQRIEDRKYRERMSKSRIVTPEQEKWMKKQRLERERKRAAELKAAGITEDQIEVEERRLEDRLTHAKNIYEAQIIKEKTEELERDPALYFSKKRHQRQLDCYKECRETYSESYCADRCTPSTYVDVDVPAPTIEIYR